MKNTSIRDNYTTLKIRTLEIFNIYNILKNLNESNNFTVDFINNFMKDFEKLFSLNKNDDNVDYVLKYKFISFLNNIKNNENILKKIIIFCKKWSNIIKNNNNEIIKLLEIIKKSSDTELFYYNDLSRIISENFIERIYNLCEISEHILKCSENITSDDLPYCIKAVEMYC